MNNDPTYQQPLCSPCATCDESNTTTTRKQDDNETKTTSNGTVKCVPQKRFPEFQNEGEWETVSFADLFSLLSNNTLSRAELSTEGEGIYNIHYGDILIKYPSYVDIQKTTLPCIKEANKISNIANVQLQDGDIVIADTAEDEIAGKCIEIGNVNDKVVVAGLHTIPCRPNKRFAPAYLGYYMNSHCFHSKLLPIMQGAKVTSISRSALKKVTITYPSSLEEQQMIASCLLSIDEDISAAIQKLEQLKMHKKALLQKLFPQRGKTTPEFRFPEFQNIGDWREVKVKDIFYITRGQVIAASETKKEPNDEYKYPVYSSQTSRNGLMGYYSKSLFHDAITWTTDGANAGTVRYRSGHFYCTNVCGVLISKDGFANECLAELLNIVCKKHVSFVGNPKLMNNVMGEITLTIPSLQEQHKISACLQSIDNDIFAITQKIERLQQQKTALLQQLFI